MNIRTINLRLWDREGIIRALFFMGMVIAFLGAMTPWFVWPIGDKYVILSSFCFLLSMGMGNILYDQQPKEAHFYPRYNYVFPLLLFIFLSFYQLFIRGKNANAFIVNCFYIIVFFTFFTVKTEELKRFCDLLSKCMGGFLVVSMAFFLFYLMGFPLPCSDAEYANMYSFSNYYFFMVDDRALFTIIPRFQSIFVEPGHLGTMTAMLLFTQVGQWRKWYNMSLLAATFISFSLGAYVILVAIVFLGLWIRGKHVIRKFFLSVFVIAMVIAGSFFYNNGDNLLHDLIMLRLEIDDGKLAGDNRVTDSFLTDYENLLQSSDVLIGRDRNEEEFGNSGYRVFIYDYGLIGLVLLTMFYVVAMYDSRHKKEFLAVLIIATLNFIVRGRILEFHIFIPLYQIAKCSVGIGSSAKNLLPEEASHDSNDE